MPRFNITYSTVTPESAEVGDYAETGFVHPNGGKDQLALVESAADYGFDLRAAVRFIGGVEDSGRWFDSTWCDTNYQTGADTQYSLHPPKGISAASYGRLARLLGAAR